MILMTLMVPSSLYILTLMWWGIHYKHYIYTYIYLHNDTHTLLLYIYLQGAKNISLYSTHTPYIHTYIFMYFSEKIKQNELWAKNFLACIIHMVRSAINIIISVLCKQAFVTYFYHGCIAISKFNGIKFFMYLLCSSKKE